MREFVDKNAPTTTSRGEEETAAAALGHKFKPSEFASSIAMIEYAIENGCPIDRTRFATFAARFGSVDVVRYLVLEKKLCEWDW